MSELERFRNGKKRVMESLSTAHSSSGPGSSRMKEVMRVEGAARALLEEVCRALSLGELLRPSRLLTATASSPTPDLLLGMFEPTRPVAPLIRFAASEMLRYVLKTPDCPSGEEVQDFVNILRDATDAALRKMDVEPWVLSREERRRALADAGQLFREIGLEHLDKDLMLGTRSGIGEVVIAHPVQPLSAHVWLEGRVLQRLEVITFTHPLLGLERLASSWWFTRLSAARFDRGDFNRAVREQEWSLLDRESLALDAPIVDVFIDDGHSDSLPPRQHRLLSALRHSFASAFVVVERGGNTAVFEEVVRGRRIEVYEHSTDVEYEVGWIGLGRVCAFDGPVHLRSPGMVFFPDDSGLAKTLKEDLAEGRSALPAAVRVEAMLSALLGERELPRPLAPAGSPREAKTLVTELLEALEEEGLAHEVGGGGELSFHRYQVDAAVSAWMQALHTYSKRAPITRGRNTNKKKRKKKRRSK